jgi:citrate synthase
VARAIGGPIGVPAIAAVSTALGVHHPADDPPAAARRLLGVVPAVLADDDRPMAGGIGERLAAVWRPDATAVMAPALDRALVLLADHELATSTLAARVAGSTWAGPFAAFTAGLVTMQGPLHGGAAREAYELIVASEWEGAAATVVRRLQDRQRLPGFGHTIYKGDDPRVGPMLEIVAGLPDPQHGRAVIDELLAEAGVRFTRRPNVDFGIAALAYVGGLPSDVPLFAIARIAGLAAHLLEELQERPLRYRGLARAPSP